MTTKNDGGAAFPDFKQTGMSLRDYFAAKAMQGIASDQRQMMALGEKAAENGFDPVALLATGAYAIADAMLAERAK